MANQVPVSKPKQSELDAIGNAITAWINAVTNPETPRRADLIRDKSTVLLDFFRYSGKPINQVSGVDVLAYQATLENRGLAHTTVYARISHISSFYEWAIAANNMTGISQNPVKLVRRKAPKPYQNESAQSLGDDDVQKLLTVVRAKAQKHNVVGKRDYALLLLFFLTGKRRREIIDLTWGDIHIDSFLTIRSKVKGGDYVSYELTDPEARDALLDYLKASNRWGSLKSPDPLWTSHNKRGDSTGRALTSHAFVKNLKAYAQQAEIGDIHLHQTRHTFGRWVAEETGSLQETQDALGHKHIATTRVYVQRVAVKKDKHSGHIARRLRLGNEV